MRPVAHICSDFPTKFGIPRQSGLVDDLTATVVFEPEFREPEALRGIEGFSHLWLIWEFSQARRQEWSPTVRPPRLGREHSAGRVRHPISLPAKPHRTVLCEAGGGGAGRGFRDSTPGDGGRFDGRHAHFGHQTLCALCGLPSRRSGRICRPGTRLPIDGRLPAGAARRVPEDKRQALKGVLAQDPRPAYQRDPARIYGLPFAGLEVRFTVADGRLTVRNVTPGESRQASGSAQTGQTDAEKRKDML